LQAGSFKTFGEGLPQERFVFDHKHIHAQPLGSAQRAPAPGCYSPSQDDEAMTARRVRWVLGLN
jgi:hypothetical protein